MTNRIALILMCIIFAAILADVALNQSAASVFLLRKLADLIVFVQFWR